MTQRQQRDPGIWTGLSLTLKDGRVVRGRYRTFHGMVHVETDLGSKTTQIGGADPTWLAYAMLRELADEGRG
jgi:hypothetical protein